MTEPSLAKWLRRLVYATALVPLIIFSQYMSPFHFGKVVVLRAIVEIAAVLYLVLIWRDTSYRPKSHPLTWAFLAFTLAFTLTTITSVAPIQSFWGTLERMGGLFTFWHYFIFYLIAVSVLRTKNDWQILLDLMVSVGLVSALYGLLQRFDIGFILGSGGRDRIFGTIGNPALFAGYQILIAYLAATLSFTKSIGPQAGVPRGSVGWGGKLIAYGLGGAILVALFSSALQWLDGLWVVPLGVAAYGSYLFAAESFGWGTNWYRAIAVLTALAAAMTAVRGSLAAIVIGTVAFILLYSIFYRSRKARLFLLGSIGAVVLFVFLAILLRNTPLVQNSPYLRRITDFSPQTFTVQTRLWAWTAGLKGFSENAHTVLVGWGPENFNIPFSKYFNPKFFTGPGAETFFDRAHNMFVEILVTMGLVGEIAYMSIFVMLFVTLAKFIKRAGDERMLGIGLTSLTIAYIIHNCFIFDTSANFLTFFMIVAFVTHVALRGITPVPAKPDHATPRRLTTAQKTVVAGLLVVLMIPIYGTDIKTSMANYASTRAIVAGWQGDFAGAIARYRQAIDYDVAGRYEYRHRLVQYILDVSTSGDSSKIPNFDQSVLMAVKDVQHNVQENPQDYLPYLYLSRLYITLGKNDASNPYNQMALQYSTAALKISPTFVRTYYEIGQAYLSMKQYDKAFEAFAQAAELNPDVGITYWYMGMVDYQGKDVQGALKYVGIALQRGYELTESDTLKLIGIYLEIGDLKSVTALYEQLVKNHPDNPQYLASLAVGYARTGHIQDAIAAVRKAISLNPNDATFVQQAQAFLRQLGAQP